MGHRRRTVAAHGGLIHAVTLLAANLVPAAGWFVQHWSAGTTLVVYWIENVVTCLFIAVRIVAHRRMRPCRGHFRYLAPITDRKTRRATRSDGSFLRSFAVIAAVFSAGHAIFLGVILGLLNHNGDAFARVDWRSVTVGCAWLLGFLSADLAVDLIRLRHWPFRRIELEANRGLSRLVVVHLTLIFGMFGVAVTGAPSALFGVFVVLKTLFAVGAVLPQYEPQTPPRWLSGVLNRVPSARPGETFEDYWAESNAAEEDRRRRNEEPLSRPGSPDPATP
ncbi:hypothetical protein JL15_21895 [Mycolicibacterium phlei DSM 43071]|nr:hypothetical protein JL15_21895 [Mycolicibacterium phlei DSM 43071]